MIERRLVAVLQIILVLTAMTPSGGVRANECKGTWVGGVELPNRYFSFVAHIDVGRKEPTGVLYLADGEQSPVAIEICTADSLRLVLQADGIAYVFDGHATANQVNGNFFPQENEAATFPFQMVSMYRSRPEGLSALEGTYIFEDGSQLKVRAIFPGFLRAYAPELDRFHNLYPTSEDEFLQAKDLARPDDQVKITFGTEILEHQTRGRARRVEDQPRAPSWTQSDHTAVVNLTEETRFHLVRVSAGTFGMGSPMKAQDAEYTFGFDEGTIKGIEFPQRQTHITMDYWLGRSEVTNKQFRVFVDEEAYITTAELEGGGFLWIDGQFKRVPGASWRHPGREILPNEPVVMVSWNDANAFCTWLSRRTEREIRLPTEAEWEYASRAGNSFLYGHGDDPADLEEYAWFSANTMGRPHEIETRAPNAWGFYDMHGNVWEWCADWYASFDTTARVVNPSGPGSGEEKVIRGGSWINSAFDCRSSYRAHDDPGIAEPHFGFRICTTVVEK